MKLFVTTLIFLISSRGSASSKTERQLTVLESRVFLQALDSIGVKPDKMKVLYHIEDLECKSYRFQGPPLFLPGRNPPTIEFWNCVLTDAQQPGKVVFKNSTVNASLIAQAIEKQAPSLVTGPRFNRRLKVSSVTCTGADKLVFGSTQEVSPNCAFQ